MDGEEQTFLDALAEAGQDHLVDAWASLTEAQKNALVADLHRTRALEVSARFRSIIGQKLELNEVQPLDEENIIDLPFCGTEFFRYDELGKETLGKGKVGFILVAGGLGERLGASTIKLALPTESLTGRTFLELFILHLSSFCNPPPPLMIMTSDDTHVETMDLLNTLSVPYREAELGQSSRKRVLVDESKDARVILAKQDTVPCFLGKDGKLALKTSSTLWLKPHGHGDVHALFHDSCLEPWMNELGIEYAVFFQDTNPSCFRIIPSLLGALSSNRELACVIACVPRIAKSATGCIVRNSRTDTIENSEYNIMNAHFSLHPELDSKFIVGNTNQFAVKLSDYAKTSSHMPEFCNPKYAPNSLATFSSPARLECLMQDVLKFFKSKQVKAVMFQDSPSNCTKTHVLYAPAKNSLQLAKRAWDANTSDGSAASSEAAVYCCNSSALAAIGCQIRVDDQTAVEFGEGMYIKPLYPSIVFDPRVVSFFSDLKDVFSNPQKVTISGRSSLELKGPGKIVISSLNLDGSLIVESSVPGKTTMVSADVRNSGRSVEALPGDARLRVTRASDTCIFRDTNREEKFEYSS